MKTFKLAIITLTIVAFYSCNKEQKEVETITIDTIEKTVEKTEILAENLATTTFNIEGMSCQVNCASKIEKSLNKMEGVGSATVNFESKTATVSYDSGKVTTALLAKRVASNGDYVASFSKSCDTKCSIDCKDAKCVKCIAKKEACKLKCAAKKCDTKCSDDCKDANCVKCSAKKEACKLKCAAMKTETSCAVDCKKACCAQTK